MLPNWLVLGVSLLYLGLLFAIAYLGDKRADAGRSIISSPIVYALSLAVYCTSWTFYGSVGRAANNGLNFLTIYIGPTVFAALWWIVLRKMIRISKTYRITSIADFAASRYGKSTLLGGMITLVALIGVTPYIALQLKAISTSYTAIVAQTPHTGSMNGDFLADKALYIAILLALFAILFGTRHLDAAERHEGIVAAIAFESIVKLGAFLTVGLFITFGMYQGFGDLFQQAANHPQASALVTLDTNNETFVSWSGLAFLAMLAVVLLPRQFQVAVVENVDEQHLNKAIWLFPLYLLAINIFVLPIAQAGLLRFPAGTNPDTFVLTLPLAANQDLLALLAYLGGVSASTSMVIVEAVALSTMVCNDLVMPVLLRIPALRLNERSDLTGLLLGIRRVAIVMGLALGYTYFRVAGESYALVSIGLVSFAAVAQFAPAIFGGMFWKHGNRLGAIIGLVAGFLIWLYTLLLPSFARSGWLLSQSFLTDGPFGIGLLRPQALFGLTGWEETTHALFWSLLVNMGCYVGFSLGTRQSLAEQQQAVLFVEVFRHSAQPRIWRGHVSMQELRLLLVRYMGQGRTDSVLGAYTRSRHPGWNQHGEATGDLVDYVERHLGGTIGAASARVLIASIAKEEMMSITEMRSLLDEASQIIAYSRQLEQKSHELELVTAELRAANERLQELDRLKNDFVSTVTHELRTPLTSIRAISEILHDNPHMPEAKRITFLSIIIKESERLTRLINQVLDLSKIESGKAEWYVSDVDMSLIIEESLLATQQLFEERNISLLLDVDPALPPVAADQDRLIQVMLNLLSNAAKFCQKEAGKVQVQAHCVGNEVQIDVIDNGPGIHSHHQQLIFEKFRQVGDTLTDKPQGTGLGLPISKEIITRLGGRLWVHSMLGAGATFSFTLPVATAQDTTALTPALLAEQSTNREWIVP